MRRWVFTPQEKQALLEFLRKLIQTPSLPGHEGAVAALIVDEMHRLGFDNVRMDESGNVVGRIGPQEGPTLMFDGHMDTVGVTDVAAWDYEPYAAEVHDGRLYGLGACDMKGGLAATIHGIAKLVSAGIPLKGPVLVACVGLEESSEGTGSRVLFEDDQFNPNWVVITEPSNLQVVRAQRGHIEMRLRVKGRSAHSSFPQLGSNAIYSAARLIFGLEILADQLVEDSFLGPGVLSVTDIQSSAASRNAVPDRCDLILDRRLTIGETESSALLEVERIIAREGVDAEVRVIEEDVRTHTGKVYRVHRASLPWVLEERHPLVRAMLLSAREVGLRSALTKWHFATEGAYTAGVAHVPTVGFGPGDPKVPHTCNEYVELEQVYAAAQAYAVLARRLLG